MITLLFGRIIQIVLSVLQIRVATTLLNPNDYGVWVLIQTLIGFCITFFISPFGLYFNRHIIQWAKEAFLPEVFILYSSFLLVISLVSGIVFFCAQYFQFVHLGDYSILILTILMSILMFAQAFNQTWVPTLNFLDKRLEFVAASSLTIFITLSLVASLHYLSGINGPLVWVVSASISYFFSMVIFIKKPWLNSNIEKRKQFLNGLSKKEIFHFSFPLLFSTFFFWFQTQGYRFIVEQKIGIEKFGAFAASYSVIAGMFAALESVIVSFYQPKFFKGLSQGNLVNEELKKVWGIALYPFLLAAVFMYFNGSTAAQIFLHKTFSVELNWLKWVVLSELGRLLFNLICLKYHGTKKTSVIGWVHGLGVIATLLGFYFLNVTSYELILLSLALGYFISTIFLVLISFGDFFASEFFTVLFKCALAAVIFFGTNYFINAYITSYKFLLVSSSVGFIFILPYYLVFIRARN